MAKAERGQLFSLEDDYNEYSTKQDGLTWGRWNIYLLREVERLIPNEQEARDAFHAYTKLNRSNAYEGGMTAIECARQVAGVDEAPMATLLLN